MKPITVKTNGEAPQRSRRRGCLARFLAHALVFLVVGSALALGAGRFLTQTDELAPADAILVLGGGYPRRAFHGVELFEQGYADKVLFSGGTYEDACVTISDPCESLTAALREELPEWAGIILIEDGESTYDEALALREMVEEEGWDSVILVTDPFHTRRAGLTFRALLPDVAIILSAASSPKYDVARWYSTEDGLVMVFDEMIKLGYYWLHYGIAPFGW